MGLGAHETSDLGPTTAPGSEPSLRRLGGAATVEDGETADRETSLARVASMGRRALSESSVLTRW